MTYSLLFLNNSSFGIVIITRTIEDKPKVYILYLMFNRY